MSEDLNLENSLSRFVKETNIFLQEENKDHKPRVPDNFLNIPQIA